MYTASFDFDDLDTSFGHPDTGGFNFAGGIPVNTNNNNMGQHENPLMSGNDGNETIAMTLERPSLCWTRNPCHNHGQCWDDKGSSSGYRCACHPEFTGKQLTNYY